MNFEHYVISKHQHKFIRGEAPCSEYEGHWCFCNMPQVHGSETLYKEPPPPPEKTYEEGYNEGWADGREELRDDLAAQYEGDDA